MTNLLAILAVAFLGYAFWQQSKQTEVAKKAIARHCKQLNLQLLSVARGEHISFVCRMDRWAGIPSIYLNFQPQAKIAIKGS